MSILNAGPLEQTEKRLAAADLSEPQRKLAERIEQKDWAGWKKQAALNYLLYLAQSGQSKSILEGKDPVKAWQKNARYREMLEQQVQDAKTSYTLAGITIVVSATLVFFFINAILRQIFVINFSVDAIVAAIAFAFLLRNCIIKYSILKLYCPWKDFALMDGASFVLAFLLKLWMPANVDLSLFVFLLSYFVQKKKMETLIRQETSI